METTPQVVNTGSGGSWIITIIVLLLFIIFFGIIAFLIISYANEIWRIADTLIKNPNVVIPVDTAGTTTTSRNTLTVIRDDANVLYWTGVILAVLIFLIFFIYLIYALFFAATPSTTVVVAKAPVVMPTTTVDVQTTEKVRVPLVQSINPPNAVGAVVATPAPVVPVPVAAPVYTQQLAPALGPVYQPPRLRYDTENPINGAYRYYDRATGETITSPFRL
jgi:hypothetical protein